MRPMFRGRAMTTENRGLSAADGAATQPVVESRDRVVTQWPYLSPITTVGRFATVEEAQLGADEVWASW